MRAANRSSRRNLSFKCCLGFIKLHTNTASRLFLSSAVQLEVSPSEPAHPETELLNIFHFSPLPPVTFLCLSTHGSLSLSLSVSPDQHWILVSYWPVLSWGRTVRAGCLCVQTSSLWSCRLCFHPKENVKRLMWRECGQMSWIKETHLPWPLIRTLQLGKNLTGAVVFEC